MAKSGEFEVEKPGGVVRYPTNPVLLSKSPPPMGGTKGRADVSLSVQQMRLRRGYGALSLLVGTSSGDHANMLGV
jgi:hypothetical protein